MEQQESIARQGKEIKIKWQIPADVRAFYANHFLVSHQDGQFILNFAEAVVPAILNVADLQKLPDEIDATVFLRVAVSTEKMPQIIQALQGNYERYLAEVKAAKEEGTNE